MKTPVMKMTKIGLITLFGTLTSVSAIERPGGEVTPADIPAEPLEGGILGDAGGAKKHEPNALEQAPVEKIAFLGVSGMPASEILMSHLGLEGGLVLDQVHPDSPAGLAGLKEHDVISSLDGKELSDQQSLRAALSVHKPGDEVLLKLIRRGKAIEQKVTLGENEIIPGRRAQAIMPRGANDLNQMFRQELGKALGGFADEDLRQQLLQEMERAFGQDALRGARQLRLQLDGNMFNGNDKNVELQNMGSVRFEDDEGSVEMSMRNGDREVIIRDNDGEVLFRGPYNTDIDKAAVPEEFRERLEPLNIDGKGAQFEFKMDDLDLFNRKKKKGE